MEREETGKLACLQLVTILVYGSSPLKSHEQCYLLLFVVLVNMLCYGLLNTRPYMSHLKDKVKNANFQKT